MSADYEYVSDKAIVRIHYGKLSPDELQETARKAAKDFFRAIYPDLVRLGKVDQVLEAPETPVPST